MRRASSSLKPADQERGPDVAMRAMYASIIGGYGIQGSAATWTCMSSIAGDEQICVRAQKFKWTGHRARFQFGVDAVAKFATE